MRNAHIEVVATYTRQRNVAAFAADPVTVDRQAHIAATVAADGDAAVHSLQHIAVAGQVDTVTGGQVIGDVADQTDRCIAGDRDVYVVHAQCIVGHGFTVQQHAAGGFDGGVAQIQSPAAAAGRADTTAGQ